MKIFWQILLIIIAAILPISSLNFDFNFLSSNSFIYFLLLPITVDLLFPKLLKLKSLSEVSKLKKLFQYLKVLILLAILITSLQLLKFSLTGTTFYYTLAIFILAIIINKARTYPSKIVLNSIISFFYYSLIGFTSFLIISIPNIEATLIITLRNTVLILAFNTGLNTDFQDQTWRYRLAPLIYLLFLLLAGITIIIELSMPILGLAFLAMPLIVKLANTENKLNPLIYERYNQLLLFIFLVIMVFSDTYRF